MFSLDLSLSPSNNMDEKLEGDTSLGCRSSHHHSVEAAGQLVRKILEQVSLNDSPPSNETGGNDTKQAISQSDTISSQCHVREPFQSLNPSTMTTTFCQQHNIVQQGHVAFASLCYHALESIGEQVDLSILESTNENFNSQNSASGRDTSMNKPTNSRFWRKPIWKTNGTKQANVEGSTNQFENKIPQENGRLQLFGSEYARYLSSTPLAPSQVLPHRPNKLQRQTLRRKNMKNVQNVEEAGNSVLTGPITDMVVTEGEGSPPKGYYRLTQSSSGEPFLLQGRKTSLHIWLKKEGNWDRAAQRPCVTSLIVIFPRRKEFVPPGYSVVRKYTSNKVPQTEQPPADLNVGGDEVAYLCFRRSREGNPITGLVPLFPCRKECIPEGYTVMERTPRNHVAALSSQGMPFFLAYRQRLANLELLRPHPLVMSIHNAGIGIRNLNAYYCTGGTVVESRVGRFHILDRSTHSLLSPSSIKNRLSHIEAARRKTINTIKSNEEIVGEKYSYSGSASVQSARSSDILSASTFLAHSVGTPCSQSALSESDKQSSVADLDSMASSEVNRSLSYSLGTSQVGDDVENLDLSNVSIVNFGIEKYENKDMLERCIQAMNFIPTLSSGLGINDTLGASAFQSRVAILTPVLTSCYTRHGGSALVAVEGLVGLLREDFFADDVNMSHFSSIKTTLLDIVVQTVCDVATTGSQETHMYACVDFVQQAMKYGCGYLNTRTIGYVLRFYLFIFYFGMSAPTGNWGVLRASDKYILEDPRSTSREVVLPGGAPQTAILSLKDFFVFLVARLGSLVFLDQSVANRENDSTGSAKLGQLEIFGFVDKLVSEVFDVSVHRVDMANLTQLALHQISRSGGTELFWYEMVNSCGTGLFCGDTALRDETRHLYATCFGLLANIVKIASSNARKNKVSGGIPRDTASKLMSLEMINFFLDAWEKGPAQQEVQGSTSRATFAYCIRRLIVPCLLANTSQSLDDPRVFRRTIQILGTLWSSRFYRKYMKLELGVLFDHFVLRLLQLGPQILFKTCDDQDMTYLFAQQLELMKEVRKWFSLDTESLVELFLNFDTAYGFHRACAAESLLSQVDWNLCQQICSSLCYLTERATVFLGEKIRESQSTLPVDSLVKGEAGPTGYEGVSTVTLARESARRLRQGALDATTTISRQLALFAAETMGDPFVAIIQAFDNHEKLDLDQLNLSHIGSSMVDERSIVAEARDDENMASRAGSTSVLDFWQRLGDVRQRLSDSKLQKHSQILQPVRVNHEEVSAVQRETLDVAFSISRERGLNRAVDYLIACNVLSSSPREIASFLRIHREEISPVTLGRYLGEGGTDLSETGFWNLIRFSYIRAISFVGMTVEEGLRHLLTQEGFRLPGEAQQIDRIISTFAQCYWEDNAGDSVTCPFRNQDTIFLLSFAIIMLNTDLHKFGTSSANPKKRSKQKMSKAEFISNLRGVGKGYEIDADYLVSIYDRIETTPIMILNSETTDADTSVTSENVQRNISNFVDNAKVVDALLRDLSTDEYHYVSLATHASGLKGKKVNAKKKLVRDLFEKIWHEFHGLLNSALEVAHLDPDATESYVDLLKYSLSITILLEMPVEQVAFLDQLGRLKLFDAWHQKADQDLVIRNQDSFKSEGWYLRMENQSTSVNRKLESLVLLDSVISTLAICARDNVADRKTIREAVRQLENAEFLLNDPSRTFVRQGNLLKRANRSGRCVEYRFFLFSDVLIYGKKLSGSQKWRIHEEMPLILMKVVDWFPPELKKEAKLGIQIYHPRKKLLLFCSSQDERKSWVQDIRNSIEQELERRVAMEGARKATARVPAPTT